MVYKKYGKVFQQIRMQKNIPLSYFKKIGISKPALSDFERGNSMMGFDRVVNALTEMGVSLEEFEHFSNEFVLDYQDEVIFELEKEMVNPTPGRFEEIFHETKSKGEEILSFVVKSCYSKLDEEEIEKISSYLYEIRKWGHSDLAYFNFTLKYMRTKDILYLIQHFLEVNSVSLSVNKYRGLFLHIAYRSASFFASTGQKDFSKEIFDKIDKLELQHSMFFSNFRNLARGLYTYKFEDKRKGEFKMSRALIIIKELTTPDLFRYYRKEYEQYANVKLDIEKMYALVQKRRELYSIEEQLKKN